MSPAARHVFAASRLALPLIKPEWPRKHGTRRLEKALEIPALEENGAAVIAAIECVVDQVVSDVAGLSSHEGQPSCIGGGWQAKRELLCSEITVLK